MTKKILIIQTAFIGDVILSTAVAKKISKGDTLFKIDYLVRKGNESLVQSLPYVNKVFIWDKKTDKFKHLFQLIKQVRTERYDIIVNLQRFGSTGLLTFLSKAYSKVGYKKNPFSFSFNKTYKHELKNGLHEVDRNNLLIQDFTDSIAEKPDLYIYDEVANKISDLTKSKTYICVAPASVWFTKQFPVNKWIEFINSIPHNIAVYIIGAPADKVIYEQIKKQCAKHEIINMCGELSLIESAALMKNAVMNYVNDSAPMHLASAVNAPTRAVFCSTVPEFGFGPLADNSKVFETENNLKCRPCGLHGKAKCPINTFECANSLSINKMTNDLVQVLDAN